MDITLVGTYEEPFADQAKVGDEITFCWRFMHSPVLTTQVSLKITSTPK